MKYADIQGRRVPNPDRNEFLMNEKMIERASFAFRQESMLAFFALRPFGAGILKRALQFKVRQNS
jgi:hypothetical protein